MLDVRIWSVGPHVREKPCWRCGYPLRHVPHDSRNCPECGLAVRISLSNDGGLSLADPRWLATLTLGCLLAAACVLIAFGMLITVLYASSSSGIYAQWATAVFVFEMCLATAFWLASWWLLTSRPLFGRGPEHRRGVSIGRALVSAFLLLFAIVVVINLITQSITVWAVLSGVLWAFMVPLSHCAALLRLQALLRGNIRRRVKRLIRVAIGTSVLLPFSPLGLPMTFHLLDASQARTAIGLAFVLVLLIFAVVWLGAADIFYKRWRDANVAWVSD